MKIVEHYSNKIYSISDCIIEDCLINFHIVLSPQKLQCNVTAFKGTFLNTFCFYIVCNFHIAIAICIFKKFAQKMHSIM